MYYLLFVTLPLVCGFILDILLGEPKKMKHPVVVIGGLISALEKKLLRLGKDGLRGGLITVMTVCSLVTLTSVVIPLLVAGTVYAVVWVLAETAGCSGEFCGMSIPVLAACASLIVVLSIMCWLMLAARSLWSESIKVMNPLVRDDDVEAARYAVSMIVGRDTSVLDRQGIIKAAVETVAENTSDGVTAPMFWTCLLGVPGLYFYKAVNTMDSMIGYKNEKYMYFGRFAARLDDVLNWLPSRLTALLMIGAAAALPGMSGKDALRIWRRDRRKHASPNSAQTESACAGALGLRLAGPAVYFGVVHDKQFIGDEKKAIEPEDIKRANVLMFAASVLMLALSVAAGTAVVMLGSSAWLA